MSEVTFIGADALVARQLAAAEKAAEQSSEHLVGEQMAAAPVDTGTLRAGIHVESIERGASQVTAITATGGESSAYAAFVHEGTSPHVIEGHPWLAWPGAGHPVHIVHHPGTAPDPFMADPLLANVGYYQQAAAAASSEMF